MNFHPRKTPHLWIGICHEHHKRRSVWMKRSWRLHLHCWISLAGRPPITPKAKVLLQVSNDFPRSCAYSTPDPHTRLRYTTTLKTEIPWALSHHGHLPTPPDLARPFNLYSDHGTHGVPPTLHLFCCSTLSNRPGDGKNKTQCLQGGKSHKELFTKCLLVLGERAQANGETFTHRFHSFSSTGQLLALYFYPRVILWHFRNRTQQDFLQYIHTTSSKVGNNLTSKFIPTFLVPDYIC